MDSADDDTQATDGGGSGRTNQMGLNDTTTAIVGAAAVVAVLLVLLAQRDVARRDLERLRGPRWLWHLVASTPPGLLIYSRIGIKGPPKPPVPNLNPPRVTKYAV